MSFDSLPDGWVVWNEEPSGRAILAYRPDVFNTEDFDAACLPTLYLTNGSRRRRPGAGAVSTDRWHVALFLEPEVEATTETHDERADALRTMTDLAARFAAGEIDYRGCYQVPRETYFDKLDELTGRES
ncbi:DUF5820 family protein [Haloferacaceae archaeon DSL9]